VLRSGKERQRVKKQNIYYGRGMYDLLWGSEEGDLTHSEKERFKMRNSWRKLLSGYYYRL
jgi:hypothetical protein